MGGLERQETWVMRTFKATAKLQIELIIRA